MTTPTIPQIDKDREDAVVAGLAPDVPKPRPPKRSGKSHASRAAEQQHNQPAKSDDATPQPEQPESEQPAQPEPELTEAQQIEKNLAAFAAQMAALDKPKPSAKKTDAQPDLTAGKRSVERLFYYVCEALAAGVPVQQIIDLYAARAEQLNANPNSTTKRVVRELHDLATKPETAEQPEPEKTPEPATAS